MQKLTAKQKMFVREYLVDLNATKAVLRAGYKTKNPDDIGSQLLSKAHVRDEVNKRIEKRNKRIDINADYVLKRLAEIDEMDVLDILQDSGDIKPIKEWPKTWRTTISGIDISSISVTGASQDAIESILKKIKWPDKIKNLELLGKHVNVQAFKDKIEYSGKIGITIADDESDL